MSDAVVSQLVSIVIGVGAIRAFILGPEGDGKFGNFWTNKLWAFIIAVNTIFYAIRIGNAR